MPRTAKLYAGYMERFRLWLEAEGRRLARMTEEDVLDYADTLPQTYSSRMQFKCALKAYHRYYLNKPGEGFAAAIRTPSPPKMVWRGLELDEMYDLLAAARSISDNHYAICCLLYFAGLRNAECASLPRNAPKDGTLYVMGKGLKPRTIPIHPYLQESLDNLPGSESPFFFPGKWPDTCISTNTVGVYVSHASFKALGRKVTPHQLRHTFGGMLLDESGDLKATGELLGHSPHSVAVTSGYTRVKAEKSKQMILALSAERPQPGY